MKKLLIFAAFAAFTLTAAEKESYLIYEDFTRFDAGTKPASYKGAAEIVKEENRNILRLKNGDVINNINYFDDGGSNYKIKMRFRFQEPEKKAGGLSISFNNGGKRGEFKYNNYTLKVEPTVIALACDRGKEKNRDSIPLKPFMLTDNGIKNLDAGKWYNLELIVRPTEVEVWTDVTGKLEKNISGKINYGLGKYSIRVQNPTDIDYVIVTYLGGTEELEAPKAENTAGATSAAEQAEAIDGK